MDRCRSCALLAIGGLAIACGEAEPVTSFQGFEDELPLTSEHFRLHLPRTDHDGCSAALDELERHFAVLSEYLGVAAPPHAVIDYYKFPSLDELRFARACNNPKSPACVHEGRVYSPKLLDAHELIHAYVDDGRPPWIFVEGLADVLSCGYGPWSRPRDHANFEQVSALSWLDLASWVPSGDVSDLTYYRAGAQLVRYLIDTFGIERLMTYYHSARNSSAPDEVDGDFVDAFGMPFVEAWEAALELDLPGGPCLTPFECSHEPLALGDSWREAAACGVGYRYRTFEVSERTSLLLSAPGVADRRGERDSLDVLLSCDGLDAVPTWTSFAPLPLATRLDAGKYALVLPMPVDEVELQLTAGGVAPGCVEALDSAVLVPASGMQVAVPETGDTWHAGLLVDKPVETQVYSASAQALPSQLCTGCDAARSCSDVTREHQSFGLAGSAVLEIPTGTSPHGFSLFNLRPR